MKNKKRVLFLCTGNSARSQMGEGILRHLAGNKYVVVSAGTSPKGVHHRIIEVMWEIGINVSSHTSKDVEQFAGEPFDYVITVCDRAKQQCPVFPGSTHIHWGLEDPADADADAALELQTFRRVRDEIVHRVRLFLLEERS